MINMSAKFYDDAYNGSVISLFFQCDLNLQNQ